ncbi:MAG: leucine-rich repeat protein, partial [Coriobacteriales bacterium]
MDNIKRATDKTSRLKSVMICLLAALMISLGVPIVQPQTAFGLDGPSTDAYNADTATGDTDDPYRILIAQSSDTDFSQYTRPSAFWSGTGQNTASGNSEFTPFAVVFEQRDGNTTDGTLVSSMTFDMHDGCGRNTGVATLGPVLTDSTGSAATVWAGLGASSQSSWTYAFRLAPYSKLDTSTGSLRIAFGWHGCFGTYFDDWSYTFDAVTATADLDSDYQIHAGDTITLTYYGGYDVTQTSRGTSYSYDIDSTSTVNTYGSYEVLGDPTGVSYTAVVDDDGYATFSGDNSIDYGGNYTVTITQRAGEDYDSTNGQGTGSAKLIVSGFDSIKYIPDTTYENYIEDDIDSTQDLTFTASITGPGMNWGSSRYPGGSVDSWLSTYVYPNVTIVDSGDNVVASNSLGNLSCTSYDETRPCTSMTFTVTAGALSAGQTYKIKFGSALCGPNTSTTLGSDITFEFTTLGEDEVNRTALKKLISTVNSEISNVSTSTDGSDVSTTAKWVTSDQMTTITDAVAAAQAVVDDSTATQETVDAAVTTLQTAYDTFVSQEQAGTLNAVVESWNIGSPTETDVVATLYEDGTLAITGTGDAKSYSVYGNEENAPWASYRSSIKTVTFDDTVAPTSLNGYFYNCTNLTTVENIPSSVTSMEYTFQSCTSLVDAPTLPDSVTDLQYTFEYCSSLKNVSSIPS